MKELNKFIDWLVLTKNTTLEYFKTKKLKVDTKVNLKDELSKKKTGEINLASNIISDTKVLLEKNEAEKIHVLEALGLDDELQIYKEALGKSLDRQKLEDKYGNDIFQKKHIKELCFTYDLKFLQTKYYKGKITTDLADKILGFVNEHNDIQLGANGDKWGGDRNNFFILAPRELFKTRKWFKPQVDDPMLFYKLDSGYYKLVHVWGKSLTLSRRLKGFRRLDWDNNWFNASFWIFCILTLILGFVGMKFLLAILIGIPTSMALGLIGTKFSDEGASTYHKHYTINGWNEDWK